MVDDARLPPPPIGHASWLDYAVVHADTRTAHHATEDSDQYSRASIRLALAAELRALRARAGVPDTLPPDHADDVLEVFGAQPAPPTAT